MAMESRLSSERRRPIFRAGCSAYCPSAHKNLDPTTNTKMTVTTRNAFGDAWVTKFGHGHEHECIKATSCTKFERAKAPLLSSFIPLEPRSSPLHTSVVLLFSSSEQIFMARRRMAQEHYCEGAETLHFASEAPLILSLEESRASIDCLDSCSEDSLRSFLTPPPGSEDSRRIRCTTRLRLGHVRASAHSSTQLTEIWLSSPGAHAVHWRTR